MSPMRWSATGWLLVYVFLLLPLPVLAEPITRAEVESFLVSVETALRDRDMAAVAESLAPSVTLRFKVLSAQGDEMVELDRDAYLRSIAGVLESVSDYQFQVAVEEIRIENQGDRARVRLTVRERLVWPDREQYSTTMETVVVERVDGALRATEIVGVVRIEEGLQEVHLVSALPLPGSAQLHSAFFRSGGAEYNSAIAGSWEVALSY